VNGDRDATQTINSYAGFGEATVPLGDPRLRFTLGGRYTRDDKALDLVFTGAGFPGTVARFQQQSKTGFDLWTGRAALNYKVTDEATIYATVGRGAKSGGYPRFPLAAAIGQPAEVYAKSTSLTYEVGTKLRLGNRISFDLAGFYNDVEDESSTSSASSSSTSISTRVAMVSRRRAPRLWAGAGRWLVASPGPMRRSERQT